MNRHVMGVSKFRFILLACFQCYSVCNFFADACTAGPAPGTNRYLLTVTSPQAITSAQQQSLTATISPFLNQIFSTNGFPKPVVANAPPTFVGNNVGSVPFSVIGQPLTADEMLLARGLAAAFLTQQLGQPITVDNINIAPTTFLRA